MPLDDPVISATSVHSGAQARDQPTDVSAGKRAARSNPAARTPRELAEQRRRDVVDELVFDERRKVMGTQSLVCRVRVIHGERVGASENDQILVREAFRFRPLVNRRQVAADHSRHDASKGICGSGRSRERLFGSGVLELEEHVVVEARGRRFVAARHSRSLRGRGAHRLHT